LKFEVTSGAIGASGTTIRHLLRWLRCAAMSASLLLPPNATLVAQTAPHSSVTVLVLDEAGHPLAGVQVQAKADDTVVSTAMSDQQGHAAVSCRATQPCVVSASLKGYNVVESTLSAAESASATLEIALSKAVPVQQSVTVQGSAESPLTTSASSESKLPVEQATTSVLRPSTLIDVLPLVPGVIRTPDGRVKIAGLDEQHSALLINSVDVTDPATGNFGLSIPIDSVETVKVSQSPYLAQYGNFTAGVVSAETRRGGDKWLYGVNDPLPDFRIRSWHLQGVRDATPRFNLSGPLLLNRLYLLEGTEYLLHQDEVRTLPFPENQARTTAVNSFTQLDAVLSDKQTLTASLHFAPHAVRYANLNFFDPRPVTPNADYQEDTGTVTHHLALAGGLISTTFAATRVATNVGPQATGEMTLTPVGNSGSYFSQESREATRFQWMETWMPAVREWHGKHLLQAGTVLAHAEDEGQFSGQLVQLQDGSGNLLQQITYGGTGHFALADAEPAVYAQDHWVSGPHLAFDAGGRWETQSLTYTTRLAPRAGFSWTPTYDGLTVIRGGVGVFYDQVPLDTYAFGTYPQQTVTTFDGLGHIVDGPRLFYNLTSTQAKSTFPLIDQQSRSGNFAPYSVAWNVEGERVIRSFVTLRARYLHSDASNQLTLVPQIAPAFSALVLGGSGAAKSRQLDLTAGIGANKQRQFFFSYVRQSARGELTDAASYLGNFRFPVVRPGIVASTEGEIPNRFLLWGTSTLPWRMRVSPHIEYRNGFPYQPTDRLQQYAALASQIQPRFPKYFSLDARVSKDFNIGPKHAVRLSVSGINMSNHDNYQQVHGNTADPLYGTFFGNYGRHVLADFDFLF
jgi:hypothetical protein